MRKGIDRAQILMVNLETCYFNIKIHGPELVNEFISLAHQEEVPKIRADKRARHRTSCPDS